MRNSVIINTNLALFIRGKMPKRTPPKPTRQKGQKSIDPIEVTLYRFLPQWQQPSWFSAKLWREFVKKQPVLTLARDTLVDQFLSFDWKIEPIDSTKRDEQKGAIKYYEKFFKDTGDYDYAEIVEHIAADVLDLPFGGAAEVGRKGDLPNGKVLWLELLDGGTLFPTLSADYPVGQMVSESTVQPVYFPKHAINRVFFSPRRELRVKGWGMAPPEKIYLAAELLNRGDQYYANLLLDTPEAGILDLGDMAKDAAEEWVKAFRDLLGGIDPFKIPVLYEHNNEVKFIPFGRPPTDLMYDRITMKYAAFAVAGYGMSLSDIGLQAVSSGGETLAGAIRQERRTRKTGLSKIKKKMKSFFDRLLPPGLEFRIIDLDDEVSVTVSRARLANATAATQFVSNKMFTPSEMRQQTIQDGLITISVPEEIPSDAEFPDEPTEQNERPSLLGRPVAPSEGGHGEVKADYFESEFDRIINIEPSRIRRLVRACIEPVSIEARTAYSQIPFDEMDWWDAWHEDVLWGDITEEIPEFTQASILDAENRITKAMEGDTWWKLNLDNTMLSDFRELFQEVMQSKAIRKAELAYEKGETNELEIEFTPDKDAEDKFMVELEEEIENIKRDWKSLISKYLISGIRKSLVSGEVATFFDETLDTEKIISDNRVVEYVRSEFIKAKFDFTNKFADIISNKIKIMTEDV